MVRELHRRGRLSDLREIFTYWQALEELVKRDLKSRYKRSALGLAWTMLNPLLMMVITTLVFSAVFQFAIRNFSTYMLSAYVLWNFFAQATLAALNSLRAGAGLSRKIYLPPALFPLAAVHASLVNLLLSLLPLFAIVLVTGGHLSWALLFLPIAVALTLLFTYGVALFLAAVSVFFHDAVHLYQVILLGWMYLTPIFYPVEIVPEDRLFVLQLSPMFHLVQIFRDPIYSGSWPRLTDVVAAAASAMICAALGWWYFERSRDAFAGYL